MSSAYSAAELTDDDDALAHLSEPRLGKGEAIDPETGEVIQVECYEEVWLTDPQDYTAKPVMRSVHGLSDKDKQADKIVEWLRRCTITTATKGVIPLILYPYQEAFIRDTSKTRLILKSRQTGISQISALEALYFALYQPGFVALFVSKDLDAAKNLLSYVKNSLLTCPTPAGVKVLTDNKTEMEFSNGSRIKSVAASKSAGRSFAASHVYMDEAAFAQWASEIYRAIKPTTATGGRITILSTPDGRANFFFNIWSGEIGSAYNKHRIHWSQCPQYYTPEERDAGIPPEKCRWYLDMRQDYTSDAWASEFDCDFVRSGNAVFRDADVEAIFKPKLSFEKPIFGEEYLTFWDIGRNHDYTVGITYRVYWNEALRRRMKRIVAYERFTDRPFPLISKAIDDRGTAYKGKTYIEINSIGMAAWEGTNTKVYEHYTGAKSKVEMISALIKDVENGLIESPPIAELRAELLMYQWDDDDLVQDCVMSAAGASLYTNKERRVLTAY